MSERCRFQNLPTLRDTQLQYGKLPPDLLVGRLGVDLPHHDERLSGLVLLEKDPGRLGQPDEEDEIQQSGNAPKTDHVPPAVVDVREGSSNGVGEDLAEGDGDNVA